MLKKFVFLVLRDASFANHQ